jgi:hypothetical protein
MTEPPSTAAGYRPEFVALVKAALLEVAVLLHDCTDDFTVVGGVVPTLLIDATRPDAEVEPHPGTTDLDLALALSVLDQERYETIAARLRRSGFAPTLNEHGNPTRQRWGATHGEPITIDFLIPPTASHPPGRRLQNLTSDLAAIVTEGADLAHRDRVRVRIEGRTLRGAHAARDVWVCGPAAFVVLKALAFRNRAKDKDAFDLLYVLRNHPAGVAQLAAMLKGFGEHGAVARAIAILSEDFDRIAAVGPVAVARFESGGPDEVTQATAMAFVRALLRTMD